MKSNKKIEQLMWCALLVFVIGALMAFNNGVTFLQLVAIAFMIFGPTGLVAIALGGYFVMEVEPQLRKIDAFEVFGRTPDNNERERKALKAEIDRLGGNEALLLRHYEEVSKRLRNIEGAIGTLKVKVEARL